MCARQKIASVILTFLLTAQTLQAWQFAVGYESALKRAEQQTQPQLNMQLRPWVLDLNQSVESMWEGTIRKSFGKLQQDKARAKLPLLDEATERQFEEFLQPRWELLHWYALLVLIFLNSFVVAMALQALAACFDSFKRRKSEI